jgi:hypothetical protein
MGCINFLSLYIFNRLNPLKPKHVASDETDLILVVVDRSYLSTTERESLRVTREFESDDVVNPYPANVYKMVGSCQC